ncbi:MAG: Bax inhibitor-1/YccA family protein [Fimbriimonadaceae bacterium]|jgi:uncharacterized YccA/Bax inhibitor family protein|nr:Bax inhibitor-1/YccA family protein [Fimbriimonadaceae bacterium]
MNSFRSSNPVFRNDVMTGHNFAVTTSPMTLAGTMQKSGLLLAITVVMAAVGWMLTASMGSAGLGIAIGCVIIGFVIALITFFKPQASPITAPLYATFQGVFVGAISFVTSQMFANTQWAGIVPMAVVATLVAFAVMFALYATRIIRVTQMFRSVVMGATAAIMILYVGSFVVSLFWSGVWQIPIYGSGWIGIGFSVFVVGLAAFNLLLDFDIIERGVEGRAPKYMEWYASFALMVTLIWLYIEILNLLRKIASPR